MSGPRDAVLRALPELSALAPEARDLVLESFVPASFGFGDEIVRAGDPADALYVLGAGRVRLVEAGAAGPEVSLGSLGPGDTFGEDALIAGARQPTTVRASSAGEVLRLERSLAAALGRQQPGVLRRLAAVARSRSLQSFLHRHALFTTLPPEVLGELADRLEAVEVAAGAVVFARGEPSGPLYLIEAGRCRAHVPADGGDRPVRYLRAGDTFGERSLVFGEPRDATVEAVTPCRLLRLSSSAFRVLSARYPAIARAVEDRSVPVDAGRTAEMPLDFYPELAPVPGPPPAPPNDEPEAEPASRRGRRIRSFPHLFQIDQMDCGAACLAMVCRHFGKAVGLARIRRLVPTGVDGTSLKAICHGGTELGLAARGIKASPSRLDQLPLPAIVHWDGNHWLVLYDVTATHVKVSDPALGRRRLDRAEFERRWSGYAALFDYTTAFEQNRNERTGFGWLFQFVRPFVGLLGQAVALALIVSGLQMAIPVITQVIVDRVLVERNLSLLNLLVAGMSAVVLVSLAASLLGRYLLAWVAVRIDATTLDFLTRRLLSLPMSYFASRRTGDIQRRLTGIWQIQEFLVGQGSVALAAGAQLLAAVVLMVAYSPRLALVFLATVPVLVLILKLSARWLYPLYADLEETHGEYQSAQIDAIKGIETVKSLGGESAFRELMLRQFNSVAKSRFRADFTQMAFSGVVQSVTLVTTILFLLVAARQVLAGQMTIGALVAFNSLVALANAAIVTLTGLWDNLQLATVLLNRMDDVLAETPEQGADRTGLIPVHSLGGTIEIRDLSFRYGGPESPLILEHIDLRVPPNTSVAVVGRSGSGKTTLIKILAGLYEPTEGAILYDGVNLKTLNYRDVRRKIGFVLQENHLFDDTIARNIAFGAEEPDPDRVHWAAEAANAADFIDAMPLGYDTRIGESGLGLSGGQRQRIAIARALYHRPPVLMFDEATSALDTESEQAVKENIDQLLEGRTSFVIAHRLSTVRSAGLIVVLEKGRLVERGTHQELMARQGLYYHLASRQLDL